MYKSIDHFTLYDIKSMNPNCVVTEEEWKDVKGYEGLYRISSFGNVWNCRKNRYKKLQISSDPGYWEVELSNEGQSTFLVHRLVAQHFILNELNLEEVNHLDGNKENPYFQNLEWCTHLDNIRHSIYTGLKDPHAEKPSLQVKLKILETGQCFASHKMCSVLTHIPESTVAYCRSLGYSAKYDIHIEEISDEEYKNYLKHPISVSDDFYINRYSASRMKASSKCVCIEEYDMYFKSYTDCEDYLNLPHGRVSEDIAIRNGHNNFYNITFRSTSMEDYEMFKNNAKPLKPAAYPYNHAPGTGKYIFCPERNKSFSSMKECDEYFGFCENTTNSKIKKYGGYFKKYDLHFVEISKEDYLVNQRQQTDK